MYTVSVTDNPSSEQVWDSAEDLSSDVKVLPAPMTHAEKDALHYIEQIWQYKKDWPKIDILERRFAPFKLSQALQKASFVNGLLNRGIELPSVDHEYLSQEQVAAVSSILNWDDKRSRAQKLRELGITPTKWSGWLRSKKFREYLHSISADNFQDAVDHAQEGLVRAMDKGNTEAIKYYMEMTGRYTASNVEFENLKLVLTRLVEVIQRHVKDPALLSAINADFELVMKGGVPVHAIESGHNVVEAI